MGVSIVFSFFTTRILLLSLGTSDYGLYNVVAGALSMLGFLSASMSSATQRFISYAEGEGNFCRIKEIVCNAIFLHRLIALFACIFFIIAGFVFFNGILNIPEGREWIAIAVYGCMIFSTVFAITIVPYDAVLNAHENMKYYSLLGIADVLLKFLIALAVMFTASLDKLLFYAILMAAESWFFRFLTQKYCERKYKEVQDLRLKENVKKNILREISSFAGWNMLNISTGMVSLYGMNIALNHFFGTTINAAMGIANQLAGVMMGFSSNMTKAMTPVLVKSEGSNNRERTIEISMIGCKYSYLLFAVFCFPAIFCLRPLLTLWLKIVPDWTELFCLLMLVSTLIEQMFVFLYQAINAEGKIKNYNIVRSIFNIMPIMIMCIEFCFGLPPFHALIDWIVFKALLGGFVNLYFTSKNLGLSLISFVKFSIYPCVLSSVLVGIVCYSIRPGDDANAICAIVRFVIMLILSIPVYWFIAMGKEEKNIVKQLIKKR